jgi:ubiquinone/menaquinone biosynthesis C-methylase UbiE
MMDERLQRRVQRYGWDKASFHYEKFWRDQLKPAQDLLLEMACLQRGERVLDTACGTGLVSFEALEQVGRSGSVTGTDISENMITEAVATPKGKEIRFMRMDAENLEFENDLFDVALCGLGLMYFPNPIKALKEMHRVLKPHGRAISAVWGERKNCGWASIFEIVDAEVASEVCPMFFNLGNPEMLALSFGQAGFHSVEVRRINTVLRYTNAREALGAAFEGGPVALAYHKFNATIKEKVNEAYLQSLDPYKIGDGYDVPGEFVIARGHK